MVSYYNLIGKNFFRKFSTFVAMALFLLTLSGCESDKVIINDIQEKEANEIIVFLAGKGFDSDKKAVEGAKLPVYQIVVNESEATRAMALLNRFGYPRRQGQTLLGLFSKSGLVPSEMEEKIRYTAGLEEQLANTIRKIDGVIDADVQLSMPEEASLVPGEEKELATASVYIKHQGVFDDPNSHLEAKIKRWVSSSVNGLEFDNVTVIADKARFVDILGDDDAVNRMGTSRGNAEKSYVSIWSVTVAKESESRFQMIFFSYSILLLVSILSLIWSIWKFSGLLKIVGITSLINPEPYTIESFGVESSANEKSKEDSKEESEEDDEEDDDEDDDDEFEEDDDEL